MRFPAEPVRLADLTNNRDCLHENNARVHKMPRARIYVTEEMKLCLFVYRKTFPRPKRCRKKIFLSWMSNGQPVRISVRCAFWYEI